MGLFKDVLRDEESLFLNPEHLDYDFQPKLIKHRESHQQYIANCIKPLFQNRNGKNLLVYGLPGIGKTVSTKHVLNELEEQTENIIPIYINCWKNNTSHKIALEICSQIGYKWTHNKGVNELTKEIKDILNKKSAVFVFDEADKIEDYNLIYNLLEDIYKKTILLITNEKEIKLDPRLKSRLMLDYLEFKPYKIEQVKDILEQRTRYAFVKDVLKKDAFNLIADKTYSLKDIRTGLFLLREAGNIAEEKAKREINFEEAKEAINRLSKYHIKSSKHIEEDEKFILETIKENSGKTSGEIYDIYKKSFDKSYRTFQRKINELLKSKSIHIKETITDKGGKTNILYPGSIKKLDEF